MRTSVQLKPIEEQVIVITGASSGIGLATARLAAERGARVVLSAWDEHGLRIAAEEIRATGGEAIAVVADVSDVDAVRRVADVAIETYGRIDTWLSNAGVHLFGELMDNSEEDMRRIFDVNYWGVVHGAMVAVPHLAKQGGALLTMASVLSSRSVPLQGIYGASKHAVKGITDALRVELESNGVPVVVTTIMPAAIHTPIVGHSKSLMMERAQLPPPMYDPYVAARAILHVAEHPRRQLIIGGSGWVATLGEKVAPSLTDRLMELFLYPLQRTRGAPRESHSLHEPPREQPATHDESQRFLLQHSLYTWASLHRGRALAALGVGGLAAWIAGRAWRSGAGGRADVARAPQTA
ncbi:MAG: SDR family oxidoreductase [Myxococcota bacterium]|nr:SDR family oxidoreductase [Myxococcota bacterium]